MKQILSLFIFSLISIGIAFGQTAKSNEAIVRQIKQSNAEKTITLDYNAAGNSSKIMFFSEDFGRGQYGSLGLKSLSFAMAFFYAGKTLNQPPPTVNLTFWVETRKPKFAEAHRVTIFNGSETLDLGDARYVSKPGENMEYLNFVIPREILTKTVSGTNQTLKIGASEFKFTAGQLKTMANFVRISDPAAL